MKIRTAKIFDVANRKIKDSQNKNFCLFKIRLAFCFITKKKLNKESLLISFQFHDQFQQSFFSPQAPIY